MHVVPTDMFEYCPHESCPQQVAGTGVMGAFDSIKMGHKARGWLALPRSESSSYCPYSRDIHDVDARQWIVNASAGGRIERVEERSKVVLDGGPRWALSTALGFLTGRQSWTVIYAAVFALVNYTMYIHAGGASWTSGVGFAEVSLIAICVTVFSVVTIPGAWSISGWKGLLPGLLVEMFLSSCVAVCVAIVYDLLSPLVGNMFGWSTYGHACRLAVPTSVWVIASQVREKASRAVEKKLSSFWCSHPTNLDSADFRQVELESLWDDWSAAVEGCARRVGGYRMLGFRVGDLRVLSGGSPTPKARGTIQRLRVYGRQKEC